MLDLALVRQPHPCTLADGEFLHAPDLAWLVRAVAGHDRYEDLLQSDVQVQALEHFGSDAWEVLAASGLFERTSLRAVRDRLTLSDGKVALHPVALLAHPHASRIALPSTLSDSEQRQADEKLACELAEDKLKVSRAARLALGSGALPGLDASSGNSTYELLELELSDGSLLLGWGWVWYRT